MFKIFIFSILFLSTLVAQNTTNTKIYIYEDKSNSLAFEDIQKIKEFSLGSNNISTGYSDSSFWLKFEIYNSKAEETKKFIKFTEFFLHEVECYVMSNDGRYLKYEDGPSHFKGSEVNRVLKPSYEIKLQARESKTIYIRFFGIYPNYFSFNIFDEKELYEYLLNYNVLYSLYIGAITALLLYNLFIFLFNREKVYLYYVLYVSSFLAWQFQINGYLFFSTYTSTWTFYNWGALIPIWVAFLILFSREILDIQSFSKKTDKFVKYLVYVYFFLAFSFMFFLQASFEVLNALASFVLPFLLYLGFRSYQHGNKTALFFIIAQIAFLSTSTMYSLMTEGYINYSLLSRHGLVLGSLAEMILFSIALGYRLKVLRDSERDLVHNLELKVKERTSQQENILNVTMEAISIYEDSKLINVNFSAVNMFAYKNEKEMLGKSLFLFISSSSYEIVKKNINEDKLKCYEVTALKKDGSEFPALLKRSSFEVEGRHLSVISILDYTLIKENERDLELLASTDYMTKLYNRRYFTEMSESHLVLAKRNNIDISVLMIDIDKFKEINDTYGHKVGDDVIITFSSMLQEQSRESDIVCRWGGEEFVILLVDTNIQGALVIAEKLRFTLEDLVAKTEVKFTVSIGISKVDCKNDLNIEASLNRADEALYEAKNSGRNKLCIK